MKEKNRFEKYLSSGFLQVNDGEYGYKFMAEMYDYNYKKFLPRDKAARILDFGCGMGHCLTWLQNRGFTDVLGVEASPEAVAYCQAKKLSVAFTQDSLLWLQKNQNSFDLVVMNDVIEHLPTGQIIAVVKGLYQALKQNGVLIIKTNNVSAITGARMRYWDFTHTTSFTEFSLNQVLFEAGVGAGELRAFGFPLNSLARILRKILQLIIHGIWKMIFKIEYTIVPKIVHEYMFAVVRKK